MRFQRLPNVAWSGEHSVGPSLSGSEAIAAGFLPLGKELLSAVNDRLRGTGRRVRSASRLLDLLGIHGPDRHCTYYEGLCEFHHVRNALGSVRLVPFVSVSAAAKTLLEIDVDEFA